MRIMRIMHGKVGEEHYGFEFSGIFQQLGLIEARPEWKGGERRRDDAHGRESCWLSGAGPVFQACRSKESYYRHGSRHWHVLSTIPLLLVDDAELFCAEQVMCVVVVVVVIYLSIYLFWVEVLEPSVRA